MTRGQKYGPIVADIVFIKMPIWLVFFIGLWYLGILK
jgi:hypothetical protein